MCGAEAAGDPIRILPVFFPPAVCQRLKIDCYAAACGHAGDPPAGQRAADAAAVLSALVTDWPLRRLTLGESRWQYPRCGCAQTTVRVGRRSPICLASPSSRSSRASDAIVEPFVLWGGLPVESARGGASGSAQAWRWARVTLGPTANHPRNARASSARQQTIAERTKPRRPSWA